MTATIIFMKTIFVENFIKKIFCNLTFFSKVHILRDNRGNWLWVHISTPSTEGDWGDRFFPVVSCTIGFKKLVEIQKIGHDEDVTSTSSYWKVKVRWKASLPLIPIYYVQSILFTNPSRYFWDCSRNTAAWIVNTQPSQELCLTICTLPENAYSWKRGRSYRRRYTLFNAI